jgi:hypothetical protein
MLTHLSLSACNGCSHPARCVFYILSVNPQVFEIAKPMKAMALALSLPTELALRADCTLTHALMVTLTLNPVAGLGWPATRQQAGAATC